MKGMKTASIVLIVIVAIALVIAGFLLSRSPKMQNKSESTQGVSGLFVKDQKSPDFTLVDFEGNSHMLSDYTGKIVVLDFWAAWCPFCVDEMPELQEVQDKNKGGVIVIGVHRTDTESKETGASFASQRKVTYLLVTDEEGKLYESAGSFGMPVAVFIDSQQVVREIKIGPKTSDEINGTIEEIL